MKITEKKGGMALSQIILLVVSIVAFSYVVGSHIGFVSAEFGNYVVTKDGIWEVETNIDGFVTKATCSADLGCNIEGSQIRDQGGFCSLYSGKCHEFSSTGVYLINGDERKSLDQATSEWNALTTSSTSGPTDGKEGVDIELRARDGSVWVKNDVSQKMECTSNCEQKDHKNVKSIEVFCSKYPYWCNLQNIGSGRITQETISSPIPVPETQAAGGTPSASPNGANTLSTAIGGIGAVKTGQDVISNLKPDKPSSVGDKVAQVGGAGAAAGPGIGTIIAGAAWAGGIALVTKFVVGSFASPEAANAASIAAFGGVLSGYLLAQFAPGFLGGLFGFGTSAAAAGFAAGGAVAGGGAAADAAAAAAIQAFPGQIILAATIIGAVIAVVIFFATFTKTKFEVASYSCFPWDAPTGGADCGECNDGDLPCSEYRCRSLGQACDLVNKGTTEELCVHVSPGDVRPPVIQPWEETLTPDYIYSPDNTISPPDRGVKIVEATTNGCVAPFTPLRFGVTLDEPAKCKIDNSRKGSFDEMDFFFGGSSTSKLNHSQTMSLPSLAALEAENITLQNNGEFSMYARCQDANGNSNEANFVFSFCVDEGPDTTPPLIVTTSIFNGAPISFNQTSVDLQVFVNEPAECRWSKLDQSYDNMENNMTCNTNVLEMNAQLLYQCSTTLTGLNDRVDNDFYFRCEDQPQLEGTADENNRNANTESFKFTLTGTRPLVIDSVEPDNTTVSDSTDVIKVTLEAETSAGFNEGEAICSYSETGIGSTFIEFFNSGTNEHSQDLFLTEGSYTYFIRCVDLGGNADNRVINFDVESDSDAPLVVRAFHEENDLKIITNENATCAYSNVDCNYLFEDGVGMSTLNDRTHFTNWDPNKNFYIKCEDEFGNRPLPNSCSFIARPFQI